MLALCSALTCAAAALGSPAALAQDYQLQPPSLGTGAQPPDQRPSLKGPVAETVSGGVLVVLAPILGSIVAVATGPNMFECLFDTSPQCEQRYREERRHGGALGAAVGIPLVVVGALLVAHGAYRIKRVRAARGEAPQQNRGVLKPSTWNLDAGPQRASVSIRWRF
jgi:hypothetical protein